MWLHSHVLRHQIHRWFFKVNSCAFLLSVLASALHQQCWMKATVEDAAPRRLHIHRVHKKMFNYSQMPKEIHHAAQLSIFMMGCVMSPFITLLRNAAQWLIAVHMDVRHRSGTQMLTLNSKKMRFKRFWLRRDRSGRQSMHALISLQQSLFLNNFAKFNLAVRGTGVSTSGCDQNVFAMPTWVNCLSSQTLKWRYPSITSKQSSNVLLWAFLPGTGKLKPYTFYRLVHRKTLWVSVMELWTN